MKFIRDGSEGDHKGLIPCWCLAATLMHLGLILDAEVLKLNVRVLLAEHLHISCQLALDYSQVELASSTSCLVHIYIYFIVINVICHCN